MTTEREAACFTSSWRSCVNCRTHARALVCACWGARTGGCACYCVSHVRARAPVLTRPSAHTSVRALVRLAAVRSPVHPSARLPVCPSTSLFTNPSARTHLSDHPSAQACALACTGVYTSVSQSAAAMQVSKRAGLYSYGLRSYDPCSYGCR